MVLFLLAVFTLQLTLHLFASVRFFQLMHLKKQSVLSGLQPTLPPQFITFTSADVLTAFSIFRQQTDTQLCSAHPLKLTLQLSNSTLNAIFFQRLYFFRFSFSSLSNVFTFNSRHAYIFFLFSFSFQIWDYAILFKE